MALAESTCQQIIDQHQRWLRRVVAHRVPESHAVADILQETALALIKTYPDVPDPVAPWLYRVAIRQVLLHRRKCGRQRRLHSSYANHQRDQMTETLATEPLLNLMDAEQKQAIQNALAELSVRDREILLLKHTENWTYRELADHLGVRTRTIEYRLLRARSRLRRKLLEAQLEVVR